MLGNTRLGEQLFSTLSQNPFEVIEGEHKGVRFTVSIAIPEYKNKIETHFADLIPQGLHEINNRLSLPADFRHFGIQVRFEQPAELSLYDKDMTLETSVHESIRWFGPLILRNAFLDHQRRNDGHRNRFPNLNFHVDRSVKQPTHYSFYLRDPFDPVQVEPRTSSTLFISNTVGYLQGLREKTFSPTERDKHIAHVNLFNDENVRELINKLILEHAWDEPRGSGEISIIDNLTVLHSSYYRKPLEKGYRIGVRYCQ